MKLKILAVVVLGAVGVGAAVFAMGGLSTSTASTTQYLTSAATTGDVTDDVAATGALEAQSSYGLVFGSDPYLITATATAPNSTTTWPVKEVKVKVGDTVAKGDVLATAATTDLKRDLANATNSLKSAQVSLRAAKTDLSDAEDADVTAQIRQAKIGLYNAESQVSQATQDRDAIRTQMAAATLKAPIAGVVTEVNVTAGFDAPSGAAIVVDSTTLQITTDVVESDLADIKVGQTASVALSAIDADVTGTVSAISPVASGDSTSGVVSFPVTITLTDAPGHGPGRHECRCHDHDPERHERADRAGRSAPRHGRELQRPAPRRRRADADAGGRGRARHEHHGRDHQRPDRGPGGRDRDEHRPDRDAPRPVASAAAWPSRAAAPSDGNGGNGNRGNGG